MHANIVTVSPVSGKADLKAFVDLPWSIYANDPNWVPPLKSEVYGLITPGKNPWFEHGEAQYFLCRRAGEVTGRISAHIDHLARSEEHTSELQSLMRLSYAVFCLTKNTELPTIPLYQVHNTEPLHRLTQIDINNIYPQLTSLHL